MKIFIALILVLFSFVISAEEKGDGPQVSELFVDLTHPKVLYANHASLGLIPASVTKLFIAASALQHWGAYHTFITGIYQRDRQENDSLKKDLIFYSQGDPEFTNEKMWQLVNNLQQMGIKKINGDIIVNASYLGNVIVSAPDQLAAKFYSKVSYDSLPSSGGTNFGTVAVSVFPGKKRGDLASVKILPYYLQNVHLNSKVITQSGQVNTLQLNRLSQGRKEIFTVSGAIGIKSGPVIFYRSVGDPNLASAALLKAFLKQAGIVTQGKISVELTPLRKTDKLLTQLPSKSLIQCLQDMLRYSNNYIADVLTLNLWKEDQLTPITSVKLSDAAKVLRNYYNLGDVDQQSVPNLPIFNSGSGLTPSNRISASNLISLLEGVYQDKRNFPLFYGSLIVPAQQTTWHNISTCEHPWMSQSSIKTGYLTVPKIVNSIAGYFRMPNGDIGAFAVLFNYPSGTEREGQPFKALANHLDSVFQTFLK